MIDYLGDVAGLVDGDACGTFVIHRLPATARSSPDRSQHRHPHIHLQKFYGSTNIGDTSVDMTVCSCSFERPSAFDQVATDDAWLNLQHRVAVVLAGRTPPSSHLPHLNIQFKYSIFNTVRGHGYFRSSHH